MHEPFAPVESGWSSTRSVPCSLRYLDVRCLMGKVAVPVHDMKPLSPPYRWAAILARGEGRTTRQIGPSRDARLIGERAEVAPAIGEALLSCASNVGLWEFPLRGNSRGLCLARCIHTKVKQ